MPPVDFIFADDLALASFIEAKNQDCMDYVYDKNSPALYGMICQVINDKHLSEECLTATFLKAWHEIAFFRNSGTSLLSWLLKLARQSAFEVLAQKNDKNPEAENYVNGRVRHYSAFELVYLQGLSMMQAAKLSGITIIELGANIRAEVRNMNLKKEEV